MSTNQLKLFSTVNGLSWILPAHDRLRYPRFSPDGTRVVYTYFDPTDGCAHIEIAKVDGSQVDTPDRVRDCTKHNEFVTAVAWVKH